MRTYARGWSLKETILCGLKWEKNLQAKKSIDINYEYLEYWFMNRIFMGNEIYFMRVFIYYFTLLRLILKL